MHCDEDERLPEEDTLLPDGTIEFRIRCEFDLTSAGNYERRSTFWHGTREEPGPDHGVYEIPVPPTGFEGDEIIAGFLRDADGFGMFEEGKVYRMVVDVHLDASRHPATCSKRFTYRPGMFDVDE